MAESRTISSKVIYKGRLIRLEQLQVEGPDRVVRSREIVRHPGAVAVLPLLEGEQGKSILLVKQYRPPLEKEIWEIPAGTLQPGEEPLECAKRELEEETGYRAQRWDKLAAYYTTPGFCDERLTLFLARGLEEGQQDREEGEFIQLGQFSLEELEEMLRRGELDDAKTLIGILALLSFPDHRS
jgi:ADP-ribose pyrophosphatase